MEVRALQVIVGHLWRRLCPRAARDQLLRKQNLQHWYKRVIVRLICSEAVFEFYHYEGRHLIRRHVFNRSTKLFHDSCLITGQLWWRGTSSPRDHIEATHSWEETYQKTEQGRVLRGLEAEGQDRTVQVLARRIEVWKLHEGEWLWVRSRSGGIAAEEGP